jgi:hypothetical protein
MGKPIDLVQGSLDFLILRTIELEPKHGWAIAKRIGQISGDTLHIRQGSLYPALYRLERRYCHQEMCVPADLVRLANSQTCRSPLSRFGGRGRE